MRNFLFVTGFMLLSAFVNAQNVETFFSQRGVAELAYCAHPTNTYRSGTYEVHDDYVIVNIFYDGDIHTTLKIYRNNPYFNGIQVVDDTDFFPPFVAIQNIIRAYLEENKVNLSDNETVRQLENMLDRNLQNWKGTDWALLLINLDYLSN